jgi:hypothetical protein
MTLSHVEAKRFWTLLLAHWVSGLRYVHSQRTHAQILASLCDPGVRNLYELLAMEMTWDEFHRQVRALAYQATQRGLVRPDGSPRANARGRAGRPRKRAQVETAAAWSNVPVRRDRSDRHTTRGDAHRTDSGSGGVSWQG